MYMFTYIFEKDIYIYTHVCIYKYICIRTGVRRHLAEPPDAPQRPGDKGASFITTAYRCNLLLQLVYSLLLFTLYLFIHSCIVLLLLLLVLSLLYAPQRPGDEGPRGRGRMGMVMMMIIVMATYVYIYIYIY